MKLTFEVDAFPGEDGARDDLLLAGRQLALRELDGIEFVLPGPRHVPPDRVLLSAWEDRHGQEFWLVYDPHRDERLALRPLCLKRSEIGCLRWLDRIERWLDFWTGRSKK